MIDYETPEHFELNRQSIASDMRMQTYLQAWRAVSRARWRSTFIRKSEDRRQTTSLTLNIRPPSSVVRPQIV